MHNKSTLLVAMIAACLLGSACSSDGQRYEGWLKYDRMACQDSGGTFYSGNGIREKSYCDCDIKTDHANMTIPCYGSWVCDKDNNTCKACIEGETRCEHDSSQKCIGGQWTIAVKCESGQCTDDMTACKPKEDEVCQETCKDDSTLVQCKTDQQSKSVAKVEISCYDSCKNNQCIQCDISYVCDEANKNVIKKCNGVEIDTIDCEQRGCDQGKCNPPAKSTDGGIPTGNCQNNESICSENTQYQCTAGNWLSIKDCGKDGCSLDGRTCRYCTENECENGDTLLKCDGGRIIPEKCANGCDSQTKQCKGVIVPDEKKCTEPMPEDKTGCECDKDKKDGEPRSRNDCPK